MKTVAEWHRFLLGLSTLSLITCPYTPYQIAGIGFLLLAIIPSMYLRYTKTMEELNNISISDKDTKTFDWDKLDKNSKDKFK